SKLIEQRPYGGSEARHTPCEGCKTVRWLEPLDGLSVGTSRRRCCGQRWVTTHGIDPNRHFRMALQALARRLLSRGTKTERRAGFCLASGQQYRNQRLFLRPAKPGQLRQLVSTDTR